MADKPNDNPFETGEDPNVTAGLGPQQAESTLEEGRPEVAAKASRAFIVLGLVALVVLFLLYSIFFRNHKPDLPTDPVKKEVAIKDTQSEPPPLPKIEEVTPPPIAPVAPPPIPEPPKIEEIQNININPLRPEDEAAAKAQAQARLRSAMIVADNSGGIGNVLGGSAPPAAASNDPNSQFEAAISQTKAEKVEATSIGQLQRTIAQGRIIQATMESALNTDLPAPIRAIVSRDTYAEVGTVPLIPKGSRLIGQYNTQIGSGQNRVFVVWTRVIRPDGVDIALGSPLVDAIGQAGVSGQLDTKFQELFSRSLVSSVMNIAIAIGSDEITGGTTTTTNSTTGTQTSGDAATTATTNALNRLGSVTDSFIQRFINVPPTILVDQGTPVNVFVNKDIVFPSDLAGPKIVN